MIIEAFIHEVFLSTYYVGFKMFWARDIVTNEGDKLPPP